MDKCLNCDSNSNISELTYPLADIPILTGGGFFERRRFVKEIQGQQKEDAQRLINNLLNNGFNVGKWSDNSLDGRFWLCKDCIKKVKDKGIDCKIK